MQIPETPKSLESLNLLIQLDAYAKGAATPRTTGELLGEEARKACRSLHTNLVAVVEHVFAPLMDRATAGALETFTMHDRMHGLKVAHLMWHILKPENRQFLTPPEIGLLVLAAFMHDVGMALNPEERQARLAPDSSLWDNLEIDQVTKQAFERLRNTLGDKNVSELQKRRAQVQLRQGEEVLLAVDTRDRHATQERYCEVLKHIENAHDKDKSRIPDVETCLSYYGDSFRDKLVEICISHNQDAESLIERDTDNPQRLRFPHEVPFGDAVANLHMIAAALRIADILDFDRERTPPILFHYLVPGPLAEGNIAAIEWTKHLTIANWHIDQQAIVFRGRSTNHITHHAVVQFCSAIQEELSATHATFSALGGKEWPFALPTFVKHEIHEEGYHYVPYRFELDDQRVYELLMGGAIYADPLVALRELVQNAVDACKLRDSLTAIFEPNLKPDTENRITVRYISPSKDRPVPFLEVEDSGTGMDAWIIERFFLRVGQSYYRSSEFNRTRLELRSNGCDFAPVSEFGIGFLSCFLLADRVDVETAMWESARGDTRKRHLQIDGPTRLIQLREHANEGVGRFKGTRIRLWLVRGSKQDKAVPPDWNTIAEYLREVCQNLPYWIRLESDENGQRVTSVIKPSPLVVPPLPQNLEENAVRIPVDNDIMEGELVLVAAPALRQYAQQWEGRNPSEVRLATFPNNVLLRGGFSVSFIPGWGGRYRSSIENGYGRISLKWKTFADRRYIKPNLARSAPSEENLISQSVFETAMRHLLKHAAHLPAGILDGGATGNWHWQGYDLAFLEEFDAYSVYLLARTNWIKAWLEGHNIEKWEDGESIIRILASDFAGGLLQKILPKIVQNRIVHSIGMAREIFIDAPVKNWRKVLKEWTHYLTQPATWPIFAKFTGDVEDVLYESDGGELGALNIAFFDRLIDFSEQELAGLCRILQKFRYLSIGYQPEFSPEEDALLNKAIEKVGDAKVAQNLKLWPLKSFAKNKIGTTL
jgi:hypothetical protein